MNQHKASLGAIIPLLGIAFNGYSSVNTVKQSQYLEENRPNIIFILTDDHRFNAIGYAGNPIVQTPEMDRLAHDGIYFKNAFSTTPICTASRASIISGLQERTHKYTFQTGPIREEYMQDAYPKVLREAGYYTGFYGKFGVKYNHLDRLFDESEDYDRNNKYNDRRGYFYKTLGKDTVHLTRYTGEKAIQFIKNAPADKPFCLQVSFSAPHAHDSAPGQYFYDDGTANLYKDVTIPDPDLKEDQYFNALPEEVRKGFNRERWAWRFDTSEKYQTMMKGYYRMISGVDLEIGKIRQELKEKGLDKNTVIILMGDNGYFMGERQLADKWLMYDLSVRVPLMIYDPRVNKHEDIDAMALNLDVPSTIVDLAGVKQPVSWHGKSLVPVINGDQGYAPHDTILIEHIWEFKNIPPSEGVRTNDWKYFRYVNNKSIEELYHLTTDPREIDNLAKNKHYHNKLAEFRIKCDQLINKYKDPYSGRPSGLMVEYIREPKNAEIKDSLPEYCWIVPKEANFQKAYQILVASSKENMDFNIGDVWDSGQVRSNESTNIEQKGKPLAANKTYFWKVRIWDQDNRLSEYSTVQEFKTGTFSETLSTAEAFQMERIKPTLVNKTVDGSYFVDFGKDAFGNLELTYKAPKAETLIVRLGEKLLNGKIDRNPGGTIRYSEVKLMVSPKQKTYLLKLVADKRNTLPNKAVQLPDSFGVITPFRYCEIENAKQEITANDLTQKAYFSYFDYAQSTFTSSDTTLNQIWDLCKYSMKATSFAGLYIDGDRERIPYEADAYLNQLSHYSVDREYPITKQTIEWFMKKPTWPTEWLLHTAMMMEQDYLYTGDTELLKKYYSLLKKKSLIALSREDGLISTASKNHNGSLMMEIGFADTTQRMRDIVDWPAGKIFSGDRNYDQKGERDDYDMVQVNTVVNCFFYENMKILSEVAGLLGKAGDQKEFQLMAAKVKLAINEKLFDTKKGIYVDGEGSTHSSLHANMMPLAFGLVPEANRKSVVEYVKSKGMACSVYGAQYLLEGLYNAGEGQYALDLMRKTDDRSWWNMIKVGSTITMEAWDMRYKPNSDWNHAWGAAPANIIARQMWGIQPETAGFGLIRIKPQLGNLKNCSIQIPTIKGSVKASYTKINTRNQRYEIELPANVGGELELPDAGEAEVTVNGEKVNPAFHSIRLEPGINHVDIVIHSF